MHLEDDYTAFCFDEACAEVLARIEAGQEPVWVEDIEEEQKRKETKIEYHSFTEMYEHFT